MTANTTLSDASDNNIAVDASWLDANWQSRAKISFDNAAQVTNDLDDFPVLVTIDTSKLASLDLSATVGADVRFTDAITGAELKYEVESWDAGADTATIWVKVPRIDKASNTDYIYVYYNHSGTPTYDQSTADEQAVWEFQPRRRLAPERRRRRQAGVNNRERMSTRPAPTNAHPGCGNNSGGTGQIGAGQANCSR